MNIRLAGWMPGTSSVVYLWLVYWNSLMQNFWLILGNLKAIHFRFTPPFSQPKLRNPLQIDLHPAKNSTTPRAYGAKKGKTRYRLVLVSSYGSTLSCHIRVKTVDPYQRSKNPVNQHQTNLSRETMVGFDILWATASITAIRLYGMPPIIKRCNLRCGELV